MHIHTHTQMHIYTQTRMHRCFVTQVHTQTCTQTQYDCTQAYTLMHMYAQTNRQTHSYI
uniref:Uncharacterized protein n=1 Tax=Anguilla anguilla TaxID=7936 RepID=A0A0E9TQ35_ANGAN